MKLQKIGDRLEARASISTFHQRSVVSQCGFRFVAINVPISQGGVGHTNERGNDA